MSVNNEWQRGRADPPSYLTVSGGEPLTFTQRNALNVLAKEGLDEYSRSGGDYVALQSYLTRRGPELVSTMSLSDITDGGDKITLSTTNGDIHIKMLEE